MKNFFKFLLVVLFVFFLVVTGIIVFFIQSLPSVSQIGNFVDQPKQIQTQNIQNGTQNQDLSVSSAPFSADSTLNSSRQDLTQTENSKISEKEVDDLTDPNTPLSQYCGSLKNLKSNQAMSMSEFDYQFKQSLELEKADPRIQAFKPILKTLMRLPTLQDLIQMAKEAKENKDENFWTKASFYTQAGLAFNEMMANKFIIEDVGDRTYLFFKLNEALMLKPEFKNDDRVKKLCEDIERSLNQNEKNTFEQDKNNFRRLLSEMGVNEKDIKFNPDQKTKFDIKFKERSLTLEGGWIEELMKPPVKEPAK